LALLPLLAQAELWGYVDGHGVAHFARYAVDARYQRIDAQPRGGPARVGQVPGKTDAAPAVLTWLEIAPEVKAVRAHLRAASARHGVDVELLTAVIAVESSFNAKAVSPRGALGLMQLMPETADRYATAAERTQPAAQRMLDPRLNIETGARMLADLTRRFGRIDVALAAWSAGEGAVARFGGEMPPFAETRAHVHLVMELYWALLQRNQVRRAHALRLQHGGPPAAAKGPPL
jgi:soluble lytic murein transglycosylase-like protein